MRGVDVGRVVGCRQGLGFGQRLGAGSVVFCRQCGRVLASWSIAGSVVVCGQIGQLRCVCDRVLECSGWGWAGWVGTGGR